MLLAGVQVAAGRGFHPDAIDGTPTPRSHALEIALRYNRNTVEQTLLAAIAWLGLAVSVPHAALAFIPAMAALFVVGRITFWIGYLVHADRARVRHGADGVADHRGLRRGCWRTRRCGRVDAAAHAASPLAHLLAAVPFFARKSAIASTTPGASGRPGLAYVARFALRSSDVTCFSTWFTSGSSTRLAR